LNTLPAPWRNHFLVSGIPPQVLRNVETQAGLPPLTLDGAVLDRFGALGWKPVVGSRYCVACLTESGGQWPIRWQLPHTFACTRHRCLLASCWAFTLDEDPWALRVIRGEDVDGHAG
jgi:TniQ protein